MAKKTATVRQVQGITLAGKSDSNHWVMMDGAPSLGGSGAGAGPKELILLGLGGCTASDVISILGKKRSPVAGFEIRISAEVSDEHPRVYTRIHLEYVVTGDGVRRQDVERAVELSMTKYCAVTAMLSKAVPIDHSITILPATPAGTAAAAV